MEILNRLLNNKAQCASPIELDVRTVVVEHFLYYHPG